jgi:hypothetical protein
MASEYLETSAPWILGEITSAEFGKCPSLRKFGGCATLFRAPDGKWWDVPDFWPETAFSATHRTDELDAALASLAPPPAAGGTDGK